VSLRLRLLLAVGAVVVVALAAAEVVTYSVYRSYLSSQVDSSLRAAGGPLETCVELGGRLDLALVEETAPGIFAQLWSEHGQPLRFVAATETAHGVSRRLPRPQLKGVLARVRAFPVGKRPAGPMTDDCRDTLTKDGHNPRLSHEHLLGKKGAFPQLPAKGVFLSYSPTKSDETPYRLLGMHLAGGSVLVIGLPLSSENDSLEHLFLIELAVSGGAVFGAILLGLLLVRLGVRPLVEIEQTAESIMEGQLSARVPERFSPRTELGRLTAVLNSMLGRLSQDIEARKQTERALRDSEAKMRRFLADASHELRTPVAAVSAYAELFGAGASSRPADLERLLQGIARETDRMKHLVEDLMLLASLDEGRPLVMRPVELVSLCAEAVHAAETIGGWPIELVASEPVEVVGDEVRLRQVVDNLLANLRAHTPAGTPATVTVRRLHSEVLIEVADRGPGMTEEAKARVFERFFREDTSRARSSGGAGLGLAIVDAIVEAHHGSVEVGDTPGGGATFLIVLPASLSS
jgi:signal transduction histidine kinase